LAAARRADDRDEFARVDLKRDALEDLDLAAADGKTLDDVAYVDDGFGYVSRPHTKGSGAGTNARHALSRHAQYSIRNQGKLRRVGLLASAAPAQLDRRCRRVKLTVAYKRSR